MDARTTWQKIVIPNLLFLLLSEEQPWEVSDDNLKKALAEVCDRAYGDQVKMDIGKGETSFELVRLSPPFYSMLIYLLSGCPGSVQLPIEICSQRYSCRYD